MAHYITLCEPNYSLHCWNYQIKITILKIWRFKVNNKLFYFKITLRVRSIFKNCRELFQKCRKYCTYSERYTKHSRVGKCLYKLFIPLPQQMDVATKKGGGGDGIWWYILMVWKLTVYWIINTKGQRSYMAKCRMPCILF